MEADGEAHLDLLGILQRDLIRGLSRPSELLPETLVEPASDPPQTAPVVRLSKSKVKSFLLKHFY